MVVFKVPARRDELPLLSAKADGFSELDAVQSHFDFHAIGIVSNVLSPNTAIERGRFVASAATVRGKGFSLRY